MSYQNCSAQDSNVSIQTEENRPKRKKMWLEPEPTIESVKVPLVSSAAVVPVKKNIWGKPIQATTPEVQQTVSGMIFDEEYGWCIPLEGEEAEAAAEMEKYYASLDAEAIDQVTGVKIRESSEFSANIQVTCSNDCAYCYSAVVAVEKGYVRNRAKWANDFLKKTVPSFNRKYDNIVHYPTNHDVTFRNLDRHCTAIREILEAGNDLVICTKPSLRCMEAVARVCTDYKNKVTFRLTITSLAEAQSVLWEKYAPLPAERIATLKLLFEQGFRTEVFAEPLLQGAGSAMDIYNSVYPYVTESICFGAMNMVDKRVDTTDPVYADAVANIRRYQSDNNLLFLYNSMKDLPKVTFKNSIAKFGR
jgi:DNA repair photolyase